MLETIYETKQAAEDTLILFSLFNLAIYAPNKYTNSRDWKFEPSKTLVIRGPMQLTVKYISSMLRNCFVVNLFNPLFKIGENINNSIYIDKNHHRCVMIGKNDKIRPFPEKQPVISIIISVVITENKVA